MADFNQTLKNITNDVLRFLERITLKTSVQNITNDAFGLLQVAQPQTLFDAQFTYGLQPLLYEPLTTGNGSVTHDTTNRCALIGINGAGVSSAALQTFEYFRYQPGKGQRIFITFNFNGAADDTTKYAQYGDDDNAYGVRLNSDGSFTFYIRTDTDEGDQEVTINGGVDFTKEQIFIIEFEALYVGTVKFGFQIGRKIEYFAIFDNANNSTHPYIATANLPIKVGMNSTDTITTDMLFNCTSVQSSGGQDDTVGYPHTAFASGTAANGVRTHLLSVRPKTTFNTFENRVKFVLESVDFLVKGNNPVYFELAIGQALTGASWNDVNSTHSAFERSEGTASGTATVYFFGTLVGASASVKGTSNVSIPFRMPITLDAAGVQRLNGQISVLATGSGGNSTVEVVLNWKEIY
jgi:hypothetical protein